MVQLHAIARVIKYLIEVPETKIVHILDQLGPDRVTCHIVDLILVSCLMMTSFVLSLYFS